MSDVEGKELLEATVAQLREENERLRERCVTLSQRLEGLSLLQDITQELVTELDVDQLLQHILRSAIEAVHGQAGSLLLLAPSGQELLFSVVEGGGGAALRGRRMAADRGIAGWTVAHNEPVIVADVTRDERFFAEIPQDVRFEVESLICVPLATRGRVIGVIQVLNHTPGARFDRDDLDVLTSFAAQSAAAIENARLYQALKYERDRLVALEEEVRRRLARDLHDGPAQLLACAVNNVEFIQMMWERERHRVPGELDGLLPLLRKALRQVRNLLFDLRPVILETQGLVPALKLYVERQREHDDLAYDLEVHGFAERLDPAAERAIFSIVQEAVGNARKHARAERVRIAIVAPDGELLIAVHDDGNGFDVEALDANYGRSGSLGMVNMRERAAAIGARLTVRSQPGEGTTVALTAPLSSLCA
jgi:signal transduction histidine kinase